MPRIHQDILRTLMVLQKFEFSDEQDVKDAMVRNFVLQLLLFSLLL